MSIVRQLDKRSGITYVYESTSYWDHEKQQARSHRKLIGRLDTSTGEVVPTDGRGKRRGQAKQATKPVKPGPVPAIHTQRLFYGATYLLDEIGRITGVEDDLKACFPNTYKQVLSIVYYLILESSNPLARFRRWGLIHKHPYNDDIPSQRSSELFQSVTEEAKMKFFRLQGKRHVEKEYWAYDTTSISSSSECLRPVRYGKNKDDDHLPQINLALLFGEASALPFYYRKLSGNIPDVKTIRELLRELDVLGYEKVKLVMDRGFYSADNINALYKNHLKFIVGANTTLSYAKEYIRDVSDRKDSFEYYNDDYGLYVFSKTVQWNYEEKRPYKGDVINDERRMYLHLYYNPDKAVDDARALSRKLMALKDELMSGRRVAEHQRDYNKYFDVHETPVRGISISYKQEVINKQRERYGSFVLLSNEIKDPVKALQLYRSRDVVEKAYWDVKERLNLKRTMVSSETSLEGKLFVEFVALIYISYIKKKMDDKGLFSQYTMNELLDEVDRIECFIEPGKSPIHGEVLKKQEQIYRDMEVIPLLATPEVT